MKNTITEKLKQANISFKTCTNQIKDLYYVFCDELQKKYGKLGASFGDKLCIKRGKEWLDIHHICEIDGDGFNGLDDIASRTNSAIKEKNVAELKRLEPYNKKEQLIYANKIEHFVLHYLIDIYRGKEVPSGGCWLILPTIFDMEYKTDYKMAHLIEVQKKKNNYYDKDEFDYLFELAKILRIERNINMYDQFIKSQSKFVSNPEIYYKLLNM